jgi:uncharacterized protein (DUF2141 family)
MKLTPLFSRSSSASIALSLLTLNLSLYAANALAGELTIEITGIAPGHGKVYVAIYNGSETFPTAGKQLVGQTLDSADLQLTVHFKDLPPGQYAAVAFQDFNGNGRLDKNLFGIPKEPYGFSNGARGSAGPPRFIDAAITLSPDGITRIALK